MKKLPFILFLTLFCLSIGHSKAFFKKTYDTQKITGVEHKFDLDSISHLLFKKKEGADIEKPNVGSSFIWDEKSYIVEKVTSTSSQFPQNLNSNLRKGVQRSIVVVARSKGVFFDRKVTFKTWTLKADDGTFYERIVGPLHDQELIKEKELTPQGIFVFLIKKLLAK